MNRNKTETPYAASRGARAQGCPLIGAHRLVNPDYQNGAHLYGPSAIYKIYMLLHRSDLNISENFRQTFSHFSAKFKILPKNHSKMRKSLNFANIRYSVIFAQILMKFYRNFANILENVEIF